MKKIPFGHSPSCGDRKRYKPPPYFYSTAFPCVCYQNLANTRERRRVFFPAFSCKKREKRSVLNKSSQRVKSVCLLWATARTCSAARSTLGNTIPPTMRSTRYPRKRWRTRSSPPSSRRRRSTSATPTSGAAALPLLHSTAPASSAIHALHIVGQIPQRHVPRTGVVGGYSLRVNSLHAVFYI